MNKYLAVFLDPFKNKSQNLFLRIARILNRLVIMNLLFFWFYYTQEQHFKLFYINNYILKIFLVLTIVTLLLATVFNIISGLKSGVMYRMYDRTSRSYLYRAMDAKDFYINLLLFFLILIFEVIIIYYLLK